MSKRCVGVWGRKLNLTVFYDCDDQDAPTASLTSSVEKFAESGKALDGSLPELKRYCMGRNADEIGQKGVENIFKYVMPKSIYVTEVAGKRRVALLCDYRFDEEHGIAIVFDNERFVGVMEQDEVL